MPRPRLQCSPRSAFPYRRLRLAAVVLAALAASGSRARGAPPPARPAVRTVVADPTVLLVDPVGGPAEAGNAISVYGENFASGLTVSIGGVAATSPALIDSSHVDAVTPALAPGTLNDVVVTMPGGQPSTLAVAWFSRFLDVPPTYLYDRAIEKMLRTGITLGCGGGNYCPNDSVTRAQMAIFILRGKHGAGYVPPDATGTVFDDVPATAFGANFIEEMFAEGITTGCGVKVYCPNQSVTRGEMAVFLMRAKFGSTYQPPAPTGVFTDVPPGAPFAKWIEKLASEGITSGCGGNNYCPGSPNTRGEMAVFLTKTFAGSSQALIADALAHGDIDYPTSLLYRAYALFWDRRLPGRYVGAGSDGEDPGLFDEIQIVWTELTAAQQASLQPFTVRPDDPQSVFGPATSRMRPTDEDTRCSNGWIGAPSTGGHFRIHVCSSGDSNADSIKMGGIAQLAEGLYDAETKAPPQGMGPPIPDIDGGDSKIDIYIVATNTCNPRNTDPDECETMPGNANAVAVSTRPYTGKTSSAYLLVAEARLAAPAFKSTLAHELFHVLQFAHNLTAGIHDTGVRVDGQAVFEKSWYVEASAKWASWQYVPETRESEIYPWFESFQRSNESLLESKDSSHTYASYIWPFFAQQEKGGSPSPVFLAWVGAEAATDPAGITDAVDAQTSFQNHFRDFAVRNDDEDLPGHPQDVAYWELDPTFEKDIQHKTSNHGRITLDALPPTDVKIQPLAAQFDRFVVDPLVRKVVLKFDQIPGADVDVLANVEGTYKRYKVDVSQPLVFCRDKAEEDVSFLIVILSNPDKVEGHVLKGSYKIERQVSCCGQFAGAAKWKGHVTFHYLHDGTAFSGPSQISVHGDEAGDVSNDMDLGFVTDPKQLTYYGNDTVPQGTASVHDSSTNSLGTYTQDGSAPLTLSGVQFSLSLDLDQCTYSFDFSPTIEVVDQPSGVPPRMLALTLGPLHGDGRSLTALTDKITGTGAFDAHSDVWAFENQTKDYYEPTGVATILFEDTTNEDSAGSAQVTWDFEPDPPITGTSAAPKR